MGEIDMQLVWLALAIVFIGVEAMTVSLATIWFAAGALLALIAYWLGLNIYIQGAIFVISSFALLFITKPIVEKHINVKSVKTNAESVIGKMGVVTKEITDYQYGQVKVNGQIWTAKATTEGEFNIGEEVRVLSIEGVKVIVEKQ